MKRKIHGSQRHFACCCLFSSWNVWKNLKYLNVIAQGVINICELISTIKVRPPNFGHNVHDSECGGTERDGIVRTDTRVRPQNSFNFNE